MFKFFQRKAQDIKEILKNQSKTVSLTFVHKNKSHKVECKSGAKIMHIATENFGSTLFGYCNGNLACTSCKVYIPAKYQEFLSKPSTLEEDVLDDLPVQSEFPEGDFVRRMSCQLAVNDQMDGCVIYIPKRYFTD